MINVSFKDLKEAVIKKLRLADVNEGDAEIVADVLCYADVRGIHSHGVIRLEHYINRIKAGGINVKSNFNIEAKKPSFALMDADGGFGHIAMKRATEWAIETSDKQGIAVIGIKNNSHCGSLGYYNKMAIDNKKVSLIMVNTDPCVIPYGGKSCFFGTNPISYGFPATRDFLLGDMATSEVSLGRIFTARDNNETIPNNWGVDENGNPTDDPKKIKYVVPFGGAKGYVIMTMIEAFTGLLIGNVYCNNLVKMYGDMDKKRDLSTFMQSFIDDIRKEPPLDESKPITIPGERKEACYRDYSKNGIPLSDNVYKYVFGD